MRFCIYANTNKDPGCVFTGKIAKYLETKGALCLFHDSLADYFPNEQVFSHPDKKADMAIVIGGDGTILSIAVECAAASLPIFGFNLGHVGFLTECETDKYEYALENLLSGKYALEKRALLQCNIDDDKDFCALNDVVISRATEKIISLGVYSGNSFIDSHRCDGIIVSTPTGSTAYSLSAGGPIISPSAEVLAVTPINAHSLHSKPMIIGKNEIVTIMLEKDNVATVFADGKTIKNLTGECVVKVGFSSLSVSFVRLDGYNFYKKLLEKLNNWSYVHNKEE